MGKAESKNGQEIITARVSFRNCFECLVGGALYSSGGEVQGLFQHSAHHPPVFASPSTSETPTRSLGLILCLSIRTIDPDYKSKITQMVKEVVND